LGRSRRGFGGKIRLVVDGQGTPLPFKVTAGQIQESTRLPALVERALSRWRRHRGRRKLRKLAGDKGYSTFACREHVRSLGIEPLIPHRENERARPDPKTRFERTAYQQRFAGEQTVGWLIRSAAASGPASISSR
jgi:hypothetical protein